MNFFNLLHIMDNDLGRLFNHGALVDLSDRFWRAQI